MCLAWLEIECEYTLQACLLSLHGDFITAWRNVMTRRGPRGAENWGVEGEKTSGSCVGVGGVKWRRRRNATADLGSLSLSVKCWQSHSQPLLYPIKCTIIQVVSPSKLYFQHFPALIMSPVPHMEGIKQHMQSFNMLHSNNSKSCSFYKWPNSYIPQSFCWTEYFSVMSLRA